MDPVEDEVDSTASDSDSEEESAAPESLCLNEGRKEILQKVKQVNCEVNGDLSPSEKRLSYLMAQSEVFAHFLMGEEEIRRKGIDRRGSSSSSTLALGSPGDGKANRTRKSEEAEDKELMKLAQNSKMKATRLLQQPASITGGAMRAYQLEGLNWLIKLHDNNVNGILADEMGLGKTLQTISLLAYLHESKKMRGPHLIIVPKSTVSNWMREFNRWCGFGPDAAMPSDGGAGNASAAAAATPVCDKLRVIRLLGSKAERAAVVKEFIKPRCFDIVVTSYECAIKEKGSLKKIPWKYLIVDEAHRLKNENSLLSQITRMFMTEFRLLITGTPLQNNLRELWALLNFLMPEVFSSSDAFDMWFNTNDKQGTDNVIRKLHTVLKPFLLRRIKLDVEKDLPPKVETKLYVGLSEMQRQWYIRVLRNDIEHLNAMGGPDRVRLLNVLMHLRKVCNHPYLFEGAEPGPPYYDGPHLWENSGKMMLLHKLLPKLKEQGSRVLIFSQMTRLLDILEDYLMSQGHRYTRIDGNSGSEERDTAMETFNAPNSELFAFLLSTRAGGLGINLQTADTVILFDSDWNPQVDLQAMDRAHRIGQKKPVRVFRFVTDGTVDVKIIERAEKKLFLDAAVIQQGRLAEKHSSATLGRGELMSMIKFGADAILKNADSVGLTDEDIDTLLDKGTKRTEQEMSKIETEMKHTLANFAVQMEDTGEAKDDGGLFQFEGENFRSKARKSLGSSSSAATLLDLDDEEDNIGNGKHGLQLSLPQREKKSRLSTDDLHRSEKYSGDISAKEIAILSSTIHTKKKFVNFPEYQFFNVPRLTELAEQESHLYELKQKATKVIKILKLKKTQALKQDSESAHDEIGPEAGPSVTWGLFKRFGVTEDEKVVADAVLHDVPASVPSAMAGDEDEDFSPWVEVYQNEICRLQNYLDIGRFDLPEEQKKEQEALMNAGFAQWTKIHFKAVLDAVEKHGVRDISVLRAEHKNLQSQRIAASSNVESDKKSKVHSISCSMESNSALRNVVAEVLRSASVPFDRATVVAYVTTFFSKIGEMSDSVKILDKVDRAEKRTMKDMQLKLAMKHKVMAIKDALESKFPNYRDINSGNYKSLLGSLDATDDGDNEGDVHSGDTSNDKQVSWCRQPTSSTYLVPEMPMHNTNVLSYSATTRHRMFSEDEDIFLYLAMYEHGYGNWDKIRSEISFSPNSWVNESRSPAAAPRLNNYRRVFQFDWFLKSRSNADLQGRCDVLLKIAEREYERYLVSLAKQQQLAGKSSSDTTDGEERVVKSESAATPVNSAPKKTLPTPQTSSKKSSASASATSSSAAAAPEHLHDDNKATPKKKANEEAAASSTAKKRKVK